jgi:Glycoside hydrolase family 44
VLALLTLAVLLPGSAGATTGPSLAVNATSSQHHAISQDIYGLNFADAATASAISLPVDRWGGNGSETYNYKLGSQNTGNDWYFENVSDCFSQQYNWCSGRTTNNVFAYRNFVAQDRKTQTKSLITLPMAGYVAKTAPVGHPLTCGYPKTVYPTQDSFDPYDSNCGNGHRNGASLTGRPTLDGLAINASWDSGWIADLKSRYGSAADGGVAFYELGNEPSLWADTHSDIHPAPESASELWQKSQGLATAVKTADPSSKVLGFSEWGWPGYFCTEADTFGNGCSATGCTTSPDCAHHGDVPMVEWYLRKFAAYDASTKVRHLDYLDVHYYAQGGSSPAITRSLWDPTYVDPSWINDKIALIPRMKCWISGHVAGMCPSEAGSYPGTKIALSEYNLSLPSAAANTNAIIEADTLGIFARESVDLATRWPMSYDGDQIQYAFRIYRNYDGAHSKFGDEYIQSTSANQQQLAIYGAHRSSDGAYTVLVLNKTSSALTSPLTLTGITAASPVQTWRWTNGPIKAVSGGTPVHSGVITATYPALSMTLYVIR